MTTRPAPEDSRPASAVLRELAETDSPAVPFRTVAGAAGSRIHGFALFLFALPETLPLPLPSASGILGIPLVLISGHLALYGEGAGWPKRLDGIQVPRSAIAAAARYIGPLLGRMEAISHPSWPALAQRERLIGLVCLYLSVLLLAPLPFVNAPPALCIAAISFGLIQRDGRFIAAGCAGAAILTGALVWIGLALPNMVRWLLGA